MSAEIFCNNLKKRREKPWPLLFFIWNDNKQNLADIWCLVFGFSQRLIQWKEHVSLKSFFSQYTDPNQIKLRAEIIGKEIGAAPGKKLSYMENKELTELDRQLITTSR